MNVEIDRRVRLSDADATVEVSRRADVQADPYTHQVTIGELDPATVWASLEDLRAFANAILDTFPEDEEGES